MILSTPTPRGETRIAARSPHACLSVPDQAVVIETDPRRLDRILGNLLDNAAEHAAATAVDVVVAVDPMPGWLTVSVADRGPGVPPDRLAHIFERFYKADPSRSAGSSGLGLAIAASNAELLGGSLTARNRDGGGLELDLRLPVTGSLPPGDAAATTDGEGEVDNSRLEEPTP